jgi:hypothetical protein
MSVLLSTVSRGVAAEASSSLQRHRSRDRFRAWRRRERRADGALFLTKARDLRDCVVGEASIEPRARSSRTDDGA